MLASSAFIIVFVALSAGAYGAGGSTKGLFQALVAYRFLAGIGIGGEYPCGSVSARFVFPLSTTFALHQLNSFASPCQSVGSPTYQIVQ